MEPLVVEYVFGAHRSHGALPESVLYLPASQAVHEPSCGAKPALHWQAALPSPDWALSWQMVQLDAPADENVPSGHGRHKAGDAV